MNVAGVVLAAGASTRMGTPKQLLRDEDNNALVFRAASRLVEAGCVPVLVVTGAFHELVEAELASLPVNVGFNPEWPEGMGASIRWAVRWLESRSDRASDESVLIMTCDIPSVSTRHLQDIIETSSSLYRVSSEYQSGAGARIRGVPALFPPGDWAVLRELAGDRGARGLLETPGTRSIVLPNGGFDLDTPDDVARWRAVPG